MNSAVFAPYFGSFHWDWEKKNHFSLFPITRLVDYYVDQLWRLLGNLDALPAAISCYTKFLTLIKGFPYLLIWKQYCSYFSCAYFKYVPCLSFHIFLVVFCTWVCRCRTDIRLSGVRTARDYPFENFIRSNRVLCDAGPKQFHTCRSLRTCQKMLIILSSVV